MRNLQIHLLAIVCAFLPVLASGAEPPDVEDGKGLVILYRQAKVKGAAIRFNMSGTSGLSGSLTNGSWINEQLVPGEYTYSVSSPSFDGRDSVTITVVEGHTYYVKGEILWGWPAGRAKFTLQSQATGQAELGTIK